MEATNQLTRSREAELVPASEKILLWILRICAIIAGFLLFFSEVNPGRISGKINSSVSLFTTAISYDTVTGSMGRILRDQWITDGDLALLMGSCLMILVGVALCCAGGCMSLGNRKMRRFGMLFPLGGGSLMLAGLVLIRKAYNNMLSHGEEVNKLGKLELSLRGLDMNLFAVPALLMLLCALGVLLLNRPRATDGAMNMEEKYRLFLMMLPVIALTFIFAYLPIYGWRYAFFDYKPGDVLSAENYVGFRWFAFLFTDAATASRLGQVLRNTLVMSGLGIATSWLPILFAVLLAEVRSTKFQRTVQTLTTIPNFISWVLVYAIALSIFSTDGFINSFLRNVCGVTGASTNYLQSADHIWLKMLLWGTWKGVGWSAIVYIAGIAGIDQQLYEAAKVDGANRFHCIWHITIPGLIPTYCVLLLMSVAGILSNGMEQYLVFSNAMNQSTIEVLDLYVYNLGLGSSQISLSTVVGISKSLIGVVLLFAANGISKAIRGESII